MKTIKRKIEVQHFLTRKDHSTMIDFPLNFHRLDYTPWREFPYKPLVNFAIATSEKYILLKAKVEERFIRGRYDQPNDPVYLDSCFEFFISFDENEYYYNFEFNCIGTTYLAYGNRSNRQLASKEIIKSIQATSSLGSSKFEEKQGDFSWELVISIPFTAFFKHNIVSMAGKSCKANFYKCGDELSTPHFVCWNNIITKEPDFHRPEFFGELHFIEPHKI